MTHYATTICILLDIADDEDIEDITDTLHDQLNNLEGDNPIQTWGYAITNSDPIHWPNTYWREIPPDELNPDNAGDNNWINNFVLSTRIPVSRTHR